MPIWEWLLESAAVVLLLVLLLRRRPRRPPRWLSRHGGTFELSYRARAVARAGRGWLLGLGRYSGDSLEWFRIFSLSPRPEAGPGPRRPRLRRATRAHGRRAVLAVRRARVVVLPQLGRRVRAGHDARGGHRVPAGWRRLLPDGVLGPIERPAACRARARKSDCAYEGCAMNAGVKQAGGPARSPAGGLLHPCVLTSGAGSVVARDDARRRPLLRRPGRGDVADLRRRDLRHRRHLRLRGHLGAGRRLHDRLLRRGRGETCLVVWPQGLMARRSGRRGATRSGRRSTTGRGSATWWSPCPRTMARCRYRRPTASTRDTVARRIAARGQPSPVCLVIASARSGHSAGGRSCPMSSTRRSCAPGTGCCCPPPAARVDQGVVQAVEDKSRHVQLLERGGPGTAPPALGVDRRLVLPAPYPHLLVPRSAAEDRDHDKQPRCNQQLDLVIAT